MDANNFGVHIILSIDDMMDKKYFHFNNVKEICLQKSLHVCKELTVFIADSNSLK